MLGMEELVAESGSFLPGAGIFPEFGEGDRGNARDFGWAHQDSNLGPSDYESDALTN